MINRQVFFILFLAAFVFSCGSSSSSSENETSTTAVETETTPTHNVLSEAETASGWKLLFDGKTTNGWRNYGQATASGWTVKDGALIAAGGGGDIMTTGTYENYELSLEWKISPKGNSGIIYNVVEDTAQYKTTYATGPEYQLIDAVGYEGELKPSQTSGANYDMNAPTQDVAKSAGEYNEAKIIVNQGKVEHWLNGTKVVEYELWSPDWKTLVQQSKWKDFPGYGTGTKGHIALQDHGDVVAFRNIKIREL